MEESRKRPSSDVDDGTETKKHHGGTDPLLKLLIPNYVAGALIGKGGELLNELKERYGTSIRISPNKEYYPGTNERVLVIVGDVNNIIETNNHIMEKTQNPGRDSTMKNVMIDEARAQKVKIVLTNPAAGLLIGRSGLTIKSIQEESNAKISICGIEEASVPGERVLTMSGSISERTMACTQIITKIAEYASNMANTRLKYPGRNVISNDGGGAGYNMGYEGSLANAPYRQQRDGQFSVLSGSAMSEFRGSSQPSNISMKKKLQARVEAQIDVPSALVGPILGKAGSIIREFVQRSGGARFTFSDKSDAPERTLTITGDMEQVNVAYSLVSERMEQLNNQQPQQQQRQQQQPQQQEQYAY